MGINSSDRPAKERKEVEITPEMIRAGELRLEALEGGIAIAVWLLAFQTKSASMPSWKVSKASA